MKCLPARPEALKLLMDGSAAFADVEEHGMKIDVKYLDRAIEWTGKRIKELEADLRRDPIYTTWRKHYGESADLSKRDQLGHVVFDLLDYPCHSRGKPRRPGEVGKPKTDEEAFEHVDLPFVKNWTDHEKLKRCRTTDLIGTRRETDSDGFLHPFFHLHLATTYRSCVAKGTLIEVVRDVSKNEKGIPIEEVKVGDFVYCYDDSLKLTLKKVLWAGKTGNRKVVRVHWRARGKTGYLDVTPEHKIRLSCGRYEEAQNLTGDLRPAGVSRKKWKISTLAMGREEDFIYETGNPICLHDHRFIYKNLVGSLEESFVVHHKDNNHLNNLPSNLEKKSRSSHSKDHALAGDYWTSEDRRKGHESRSKNHSEGLWDLKGEKNGRFIKLGKSQILRILAESSGRCSKGIPYDFTAFKQKADAAGIDLKAVKDRYDKNGKYISLGRLKRAFNGKLRSVVDAFGCNYEKAERLLIQRGIQFEPRGVPRNEFGCKGKPNNHQITRIEYLEETVDVYDLEVEDCHNFIANEICVHNSSSDPNFQNKPNRDKRLAKLVRTAFIPRGPDYCLIEADFGAQEFKGAACFWKDPGMVAYASDPKFDIHKDMAAEIYLLNREQVSGATRGFAKNKFVFPTLYGSWWKSTGNDLWTFIERAHLATKDGVDLYTHLKSKGIKDKEAFLQHTKKVEEDFNKKFPTWSEEKTKWWDTYLKNGEFPLMTGFVCRGVYSYNNLMNTPIQGPSFHCLLWSVIQVNRYFKEHKMRSRVIGQIHDSIAIDAHKDELQDVLDVTRRVMEFDVRRHWDWIIVPLLVEVDVSFTNWFEKASWVETPGGDWAPKSLPA